MAVKFVFPTTAELQAARKSEIERLGDETIGHWREKMRLYELATNFHTATQALLHAEGDALPLAMQEFSAAENALCAVLGRMRREENLSEG